jgi:hypothetical protein
MGKQFMVRLYMAINTEVEAEDMDDAIDWGRQLKEDIKYRVGQNFQVNVVTSDVLVDQK